MHPSLKVYKDQVFNYINRDFEIIKLSADCLFTEGPVWNPDGFYLFSDIPANCIYKISEGRSREIFLKNSGTDDPGNSDLNTEQAGSNALAYNSNGDLLVCQHGEHGIAKYNGKDLLPFIHAYQNKPFNSPNDLILHSDGRIYFSDPPYGLKNGKPNPEKFQPVAGVYCYSNGELEIVCDKYQYPNGVCLSRDETVLYICSNKPFEKFISAYETSTHRFIKTFAEETSDGIECDEHDNIYLCNKDGIIILDPQGQRLALIELESIPANICWGGKDLKDLFITARQNIFLIKDFHR
jgi:gluconolactonase